MEAQLIQHNTITSAPGSLFRRGLARNLLALAALLLILGSIIGVQVAASAAGPPPYVPLAHSVMPSVAHDRLLGHHNPNAPLTFELVLHPNDQAGIDQLIAALYNPQSEQYQQWLPTGEFARRFAPTADQLAAVEDFLTKAGLDVVAGAPGPFLLRAKGSSARVEAAFHTHINNYRAGDGRRYFANATDPMIPANLSGIIDGVVGLENYTRLHTNHTRTVSPHYGGGPGGTGLTPSQIAGIYLANPLYALGDHGAGRTLGVFELSNYTQGDISVYCTQFSLTCPTLTNINVDGGSGTDHSGAGEVELDIELQIALAPATSGILVYNSPNSGSGVVDQYAKIAADNLADSISTSWGICEPFSSSGIWDSEFTSFEMMATQGQTIFAASGDAGAFDCLRVSSNGSNQVDDPASNPYMTGVGGTSLGSFDPGTNPNPVYPATGESVWNNGCTSTSCSGAGGGGNSKIWAKPPYQVGPGVTQSYSKFSPWCSQPAGTQCREVPDVSMNANPNTGYAIFCTDSGDSSCFGWVQFGGTSCAAPLWAAIIDLTDSFHSNNRLGEASFNLYTYDSSNGYHFEFHDVTSGNNGWFPARANYDLATGIGTPKIYYLATQLP